MKFFITTVFFLLVFSDPLFADTFNKKRTWLNITIDKVKAVQLPEGDGTEADLYFVISIDVFDNKNLGKKEQIPVYSKLKVTTNRYISSGTEIEIGEGLAVGNWDNHSVFFRIYAFDADFGQDLDELEQELKEEEISEKVDLLKQIAIQEVVLFGYKVGKDQVSKYLSGKSSKEKPDVNGSSSDKNTSQDKTEELSGKGIAKEAAFRLGSMALTAVLKYVGNDDSMGDNLVEISPYLYEIGTHFEYIKLRNVNSNMDLRISIKKSLSSDEGNFLEK